MTPQQLAQILQIANYVFIGLFVLVFLGLALAAFIGWKRGVWNSTFRLIFMLIIVLTTYSFTGLIAQGVGSIDLSFLNIAPIQISGQSGSASVEVTSIYETLSNFIYQAFIVNGITINGNGALSTTIVQLTNIFLVYICLIVESLLCFIFGSLLCTIFWHALFKHLIPKPIRAKKVKPAGLAAGVVKYVVVSALLLSPFTALVNTVVRTYKKASSGTPVDSEMLQTVDTFVDAYDNSIFAQTFFNWTANSEGETLDVQIADLFASVKIGEGVTSLTDTLSDVTRIGTILLDAGLIDQADGELMGTLLTSDGLVTSLLCSVADSELVTSILPIAVELILNSDVLAQYIPEGTLDVSDVSWRDEIRYVASAYQGIVDSGLIDSFIDENGQISTNINAQEVAQAMLSSSKYGYVHNLFKSIEKSKLLSRAIPALVYGFTQNPDFANNDFVGLLPTSWDQIRAIDWGEELCIVHDSLYQVNAICPELITKAFSLADNGTSENVSTSVQGKMRIKSNANPNYILSSLQNNPLDETSTSQNQEATELALYVLQHIDSLKDAFVGQVDEKGNLLNVNENGETIVYDENGNRINGRLHNLLDSSLLRNSFSSLIEILLSGNVIPSEYGITSGDITDIIDGFVNAADYKKELGGILGLLGEIGSDSNTLNLIINLSNNQTITISEDNINVIASAIRHIDDSSILSTVLPKALKVSSQEGGALYDAISKLGGSLSKLKLNFDEITNFGSEIANLLTSVGQLVSLQSVIGDGSNVDAIVEALPDYEEQIVNVLDVMLSSQILNKQSVSARLDAFGHIQRISTLSSDSNFYVLLDYLVETLFSGMLKDNPDKDAIISDIEQQMREITPTSWTNSRNSNGDFIRGVDGKAIYNGETGYFVDALVSITQTGIVDAISDIQADQNRAIAILSELDISGIFTSIGTSELLSTIMGNALDVVVSESLGENFSDLSFKHIESWQEEGENFESAIHSLMNLTNNTGSIEQIDFLNSDPENVNSLLTSLGSSQLFFTGEKDIDGNNVTKFGNFLNSIMTTNADIATYFKDPNAETFTIAKSDFEKYDTVDDWTNEEGTGQIDYFCNTLTALKNANYDDNNQKIADNPLDAFTSLSVTPAKLQAVLDSLNECGFLRIMIYNALDSVFAGSYSSGTTTINLSNANTESLVCVNSETNQAMSEEQRGIELGYFVDFYEFIFDKITKDGNGDITITISLDNISGEEISSLLTSIYNSSVLNSFYIKDEGVTNAFVALPSDRPTATSLTIFETLIKTFVDLTGMGAKMVYGSDTIESMITGIGNSKAVTGSTDGWSNTNGEISKLTSIVDYAKDFISTSGALDISYQTIEDKLLTKDEFGTVTGINQEGVDLLNELFASIDNSKLLYRVLPNSLDEVLTSSNFSSLGLDTDNANTFFAGHYSNYGEEQISILVDLFANGIYLSSLGSNLSSLSSITNNMPTIDSLLNELHDSKVFNSLSDGDYDNKLTVFEDVINTVITTGGISQYVSYSDELGVTHSVEEVIRGVTNSHGTTSSDSWNETDGEISKLLNVVKKADEFNSGSTISLSWDTIKTKINDTDLEGNNRFETLLNAIDNSKLLFRVIPNSINDVTTSSSLGSLSSSLGFDLGNANPYFNGSNEKYGESEIANLVSIFKGAAKDISFSDISSFSGASGAANREAIRTLLTDLSSSHVFNTLSTRNALISRANNDLTVFESAIYSILESTDSVKYVGKDSSTTPIGDLSKNAKGVIINVGNPLEDALATDGWNGTSGEISKLMGILENCSPFLSSNQISLTYDSLSSMDRTTLINFLESINDSKVFRRVLPGNLSSALLSAGSGDLSGIDITNANCYYKGFGIDETSKYDNSEIELIVDILLDFGDVMDYDYSNLASVDTSFAENLLLNLYASNVFNTTSDEASSTALTVFESMMKKLYTDSTLSSLSYSAQTDGFINADDKLNDKILNFKDFTALNSINAGSWEHEIASFTSLLNDVKLAGLSSINFSSSSLDSLSPTIFAATLNDLNSLDCVNDAVQSSMRNMFDGMHISNFSTLSGTNYAKFDITCLQYKEDIPLFYDVLSALGTPDDLANPNGSYTYVDLTSGSGLLDLSGRAIMTPMLNFLAKTNIYSYEVEDYNFSAHSLFLYNMLNFTYDVGGVIGTVDINLSNNFYPDTSLLVDDCFIIETIFEDETTNLSIEGAAFDEGTLDLARIEAICNYASSGADAATKETRFDTGIGIEAETNDAISLKKLVTSTYENASGTYLSQFGDKYSRFLKTMANSLITSVYLYKGEDIASSPTLSPYLVETLFSDEEATALQYAAMAAYELGKRALDSTFVLDYTYYDYLDTGTGSSQYGAVLYYNSIYTLLYLNFPPTILDPQPWPTIGNIQSGYDFSLIGARIQTRV